LSVEKIGLYDGFYEFEPSSSTLKSIVFPNKVDLFYFELFDDEICYKEIVGGATRLMCRDSVNEVIYPKYQLSEYVSSISRVGAKQLVLVNEFSEIAKYVE
jgi:hypothetical protein